MPEEIIEKTIKGEKVYFRRAFPMLQWYFKHEGLMHGDTLILSPAVIARWDELKEKVIERQTLKIMKTS